MRFPAWIIAYAVTLALLGVAYVADEAFFTGTASEIIAIRELDGRVIGSGGAGPVTRDLTDRFRAMVRGGGS